MVEHGLERRLLVQLHIPFIFDVPAPRVEPRVIRENGLVDPMLMTIATYYPISVFLYIFTTHLVIRPESWCSL
jgi:hypothetical protein